MNDWEKWGGGGGGLAINTRAKKCSSVERYRKSSAPSGSRLRMYWVNVIRIRMLETLYDAGGFVAKD